MTERYRLSSLTHIKIDLKSAYRHVAIHPPNYNAIGIAWKFRGANHTSYMCYCKLPFCALKSWEMFHRIIQSTTTMMTRRGFLTVLAYLNDFLITADSERKWEIVYHELIR